MDPITDTGDLLVQPNTSAVRRAEALRLGVLESVLPGPAAGVPAKEIVDFKERYKDRLGAFRTYVEEELLAIALIEEQDARLRKRQLVEERLRGEIDEIVARMRERRWPKIVFGTVCGIAAVGVAAIGAVTTGGVAVALAVPGLVSGAYAAIEGAPKRDVSRSPVAYAALAEKYFGRH